MSSGSTRLRINIFDLNFIGNRRSNSADFPIFGGHARQRGRGFGALAQFLERTAIPFMKKKLVPAVKRMGADLLKSMLQKLGKLLLDVENSKYLQKCGNKNRSETIGR